MDRALGKVLLVNWILGMLSIFGNGATTNTDTVHSGNLRQFRYGEIILGAAIEGHRHTTELECSELRGKGVQDVELINMIVDQVNANDTLLPGITLGTVMIDSCAWPAHALKQIVSHILPFVTTDGTCDASDGTNRTKPVFAGLIGEGTSTVSMQIAYLLQSYSISQVSHWATSQDLSKKEIYPYFFRTIAADSFQTRAIVEFVKKMKWDYVSVVYEEDCYGRDSFLAFSEHAEKHRICVEFSEKIPTNGTDEIYLATAKKLRDADAKAKVVVVFTKTTPAEKLINASHFASTEESPLIWIAANAWAGSLPKISDDSSYVASLDGAIGFKPKGGPVAGFNDRMRNFTLENLKKRNHSTNPWLAEYIAKENGCSLSSSSSKRCNSSARLRDNFEGYSLLQNLANAVWSFVYALDAYHQDKCGGSSGMCDAMTNMAGTNQLAAELFPYMKEVSFLAENGEDFRFDENQDGPPFYDVINFQKDKAKPSDQKQGWISIGVYKRENITIEEVPEKANGTKSICSDPCADGYAEIRDTEICCFHCAPCNNTQFVSNVSHQCEECPERKVPTQKRNSCRYIEVQLMHFGRIHCAIPLLLSLCFIVCTLGVIAIFIKYRMTPIVKASGKELSIFVLAGVLLTFANSAVICSDATMFSCIASRFILAVGPTCMYAGLLVKTIRVVIIFRSRTALSKRMKQFLQPWCQLVVALCVVIVQILVLIGWLLVYRAKAEDVYPTRHTAFRVCRCLTHSGIFIGIIYPVMLIMACTVLATINRKVPTGFNETSYIGFTMYATCVIWLAFPPIFLTNSENIPQKLMTTSICLSLSAVTVLCCLFVPRCYTILFRPEDNNSQTVMSQTRYKLNAHQQALAIMSPNPVHACLD